MRKNETEAQVTTDENGITIDLIVDDDSIDRQFISWQELVEDDTNASFLDLINFKECEITLRRTTRLADTINPENYDQLVDNQSNG